MGSIPYLSYMCFSIDSTLDSSLLSNIQKLFYERIEVFGTVQFDKASIVTGIIKIFLKVCLHRTFATYMLVYRLCMYKGL